MNKENEGMSFSSKMLIGSFVTILILVIFGLVLYFVMMKPGQDKSTGPSKTSGTLSGTGTGTASTGTSITSLPVTVPPPPVINRNQVMGRYIKLSKPPNDANCLHLMEMRVYSILGGVNIVNPLMTVTKSSVWSDDSQFPNAHLMDNRDDTMIHTSCANETQWIMLDMKTDVPVSEIKLVSRQDCCGNQMNGIVLEITNSSNVTVYKANPIKSPSGSIISNNGNNDYYKFYKYAIPSLDAVGTNV